MLWRVWIAKQRRGERWVIQRTVPAPPVATRTLNLESVSIPATRTVETQQPPASRTPIVTA